MKRKTPSQRIPNVFYFLPIVLALCLAAPWLFVGGNDPRIVLRQPSVMAAGPHSHTVSAPLTILGGPEIVLRKGTISITGNAASGKLSATNVVKLLTSGSADLTLEHANLSVTVKAPDGTHVAPSTDYQLAPFEETLRQLAFSKLSIRDTTIAISMPGARPGQGHIFENANLDLLLARDKRSLTVKGQVVFRSKKISVDAALSIPKGTDPASAKLPFRATLGSELVTSTLSGHLLLGQRSRLVAPSAKLTITNVGKAASWLGLTWPDRPMVSRLEAYGDLDWAGSILSFQNATFQIDDDTATGTLALNTKGTRTAIDGTLAFDTLNLTNYLSSSPTLLQPVLDNAAWIPEMSALSAHLSGFKFLEQIDADLRLSTNRARVGGLAFGRSAATISLRDGKLLADVAELHLANGGQGALQFNMDVTEPIPSCKIRGRIKGMEVGHASSLLFDHAVLSGPGEVTIDLAGQGYTGTRLINSLGGSIGVRMSKGADLGIDLNTLIAAARSADDDGASPSLSAHSATARPAPSETGSTSPMGPPTEGRAGMATAWSEATRGRTRFKEAIVELELSEGVAHAKAFEGLAPTGAQVAASGTIHLGKSELDVTFRIGHPGQPEDGLGKILHVTGNRASPNISVREGRVHPHRALKVTQ